MARERVAVFGAGGHAKVVIATLVAAGHTPTIIYDDDERRWGGELMGVSIRSTSEAETRPPEFGVIAVGSNAARAAIAQRFPSVGWVTAVHPGAVVHESVRLGAGTVVFAGAVLQPDTRIGCHGIINTGATVDHDCDIGDYVHLAPGVHLAGAVRVADRAFLGIGVVAVPGVQIGAGVTLGAGAVVTRDIHEAGTWVGVPARRIG